MISCWTKASTSSKFDWFFLLKSPSLLQILFRVRTLIIVWWLCAKIESISLLLKESLKYSLIKSSKSDMSATVSLTSRGEVFAEVLVFFLTVVACFCRNWRGQFGLRTRECSLPKLRHPSVLWRHSQSAHKKKEKTVIFCNIYTAKQYYGLAS